MRKLKFGNRLLAWILAIVLCAGLVPPASAAGMPGSAAVTFQQVDNHAVSVTPSGLRTLDKPDAASPYGSTDTVRVSILLHEKSTLEQMAEVGVTAADIASNQSARSYRTSLEKEQAGIANAISAQALDGEELDVVWNLTLAANIISANVQYGQIEKIKQVRGVADVILENRYEPAVVSGNGAADPNMATSSAQIGSAAAWAAGYTGAGQRIAVVDTGIDVDHQSFSDTAFAYSLEKNAEKADMTKDAYLDSLDLLDQEEIARVYDQLNVYKVYTKPNGPQFDSKNMYISTKIPFAFNYIDRSLNVDHSQDNAGEHGSHVEGIAAANTYIPNGDGTFSSALDTVKVQGVAPDAQILVMKIFGKNGGAYDSDYLSAIEDAIVLGADAVNLSLGSASPGMSKHLTPTYQAVMDTLVDYGTVVAMSAGNSGPWPEQSGSGGYLYADDVSMQTNGAPGSFINSLAVASVENDGYTGTYISVNGSTVFYTETLYNNQALTSLAGEREYVFCGGQHLGSAAEWALAGDALEGKIAVCYRGDISFVDKATAAVASGAAGVIICNNAPGTINMDLTSYSQTAPCVSVTQEDGKLLYDAATPVMGTDGEELYRTGKFRISDQITAVNYNSEYQTMSDFSSWGVPGSLQIKPEITAPGGNIYSVNGAVEGGKAYETMSGTSMASPQVAGMAALMSQYTEKNGLDKKTGLTARQLVQSLLMSTAVPMRDTEDHNYYSILQQGAGLANVGAAVAAESYIQMDDRATISASDGKVKVELGDDPNRDGEYTFSFSIHNLTEQALSYDLSADLFTQGILQLTSDETGETTSYMDYATTPLDCTVAWTVDGVPFTPGTAVPVNMDFNGDGEVSNEDCTALLEYVVGARESISHQENADLNGDGKITSYDAYLFLNRANAGVVTVPASGSVDVTVTMTLTDSQKQTLNTQFPNGAYVEGFVYAKAAVTEEGAVGTTHSIPVLGFYGNWSDPSMFDVGTYLDYAQGMETREPYLSKQGNAFGITYASDPYGTYIFGGNPLGTDEVYKPERNAINSRDQLSSVVFIAIRNAIDSRFVARNETQDQTLLDQTYGPVGCAYYYPNDGTWKNIGHELNPGLDPSEADEGDKLTFTFTIAPEYYMNGQGDVDWSALGEGTSLSISAVVDNTAPVIAENGVVIDMENKKLHVTASDNQYISAVVLYNGSGSKQLASADAKMDIEAGQSADYELDLSHVNGKGFLVQVYDYAMNAATYYLDEQIGELNPVPEAIAFDLVYNEWREIETEPYYSDYKKITEADSSRIFYAAAFVDPILFASTSTGDLYAIPKEDLTDCKLVRHLGVVLTDMAYCQADGKIYGVYSVTKGETHSSYLVTVDKLTGALTQVGEIGVWTNTLACDKDGTFYCNELQTGNVYTFTASTAANPTLLVTVTKQPYGDAYATSEDVQTMEINPANGNLYWMSFYRKVTSILPGFPPYTHEEGYCWEITPNTKAVRTVSSLFDQMSCLTYLTSDSSGDTGWAEATDEISGVQISTPEVTLLRGDHVQLSATATPWMALNREITWSTSDPNVADVDVFGMVSAIGKGTCTITATSAKDPTKTASCQVTVELLDVTLKGALQDADGQAQLFTWNMQNPTWTAAAQLDRNLAFTSMTRNEKTGSLYIMASNAPYSMYEVNPETGAYIGDAAQSPLDDPWPWWDMAYSTKFSTDHTPAVVSIFNYYLFVPQDPMHPSANPFAFNMTTALTDYGADYLVAIASMGETTVTYEDEATQEEKTVDTEHFTLLDNGGNLINVYIYEDENGFNLLRTRYTSNLEEVFLGDETGNMYCSMVAGDDGNLYLAVYNTATSWLYRLTPDDEAMTCTATPIGDVGLNIWPAALYEVTTNAASRGNASIVLQNAEPQEAVPCTAGAAIEGEATPANEAPASEDREAPVESAPGSLNAVTAAAPAHPMADEKEDGDTVTLQITAKDAAGMDVDSANGKLTVTYDAAVLELTGVNMIAPYSAYQAEEGSATLAYAANSEIPAGTPVAELTLTRKSPAGSTITVSHLETASAAPDYTETVSVPEKSHEAVCPSKAFQDLDASEWYHEYTDYVIARGLMKGMDKGKFSPNGTLTRGMLVTTLYRLAEEPEVTEPATFTDVPQDQYYAEAIAWAEDMGIALGVGGTKFSPNAPVTREQTATFLYRYVTEYRKEEPVAGADLSQYTDAGKISPYAKEAMAWATAAGFLEGYGDGTVGPQNTSTRAQMAKFLTILGREF